MNLPWGQQISAVLPWRRTALLYCFTVWSTDWMCCYRWRGIGAASSDIRDAPNLTAPA